MYYHFPYVLHTPLHLPGGTQPKILPCCYCCCLCEWLNLGTCQPLTVVVPWWAASSMGLELSWVHSWSWVHLCVSRAWWSIGQMFSVENRATDSHWQNFIFHISKTINKQDHNSKVGKWSMRGQISLYSRHVQANKPTNLLLFLTILGSPSPLVSACSRICQGSSENFRNPPWISNLAPSPHSLKETAVCVCFSP